MIRDFAKDLKKAVAALRKAGFKAEADELEVYGKIAWTTSTEMCGEIALCVRRLQERFKRKMPLEAEEALERVMAEIRRVWPKV